MPATMKDSATAGPALTAAARPVSTKMPVPMMAPMPEQHQVQRRQRAFEAVSVLGVGAQLIDGFGREERIGHRHRPL